MTCRGYEQCHFFAGIGGWPLALEWAGWRGPVWTGSCPCQPLSSAGQRKGDADERHLWPAFQQLIARVQQPPVVFGEQVASKDGREWLSAVRTDSGVSGICLRGRRFVGSGRLGRAAHPATALLGGRVQRGNKVGDATNPGTGRCVMRNEQPFRTLCAPWVAQLSGWPSPLANKLSPQQRADFTPNLANVAQLTGWATPRSTEAGHSTGNPERAIDNKSRLEDQVFLSGWPTPNAIEPEGPKDNPAQFWRRALVLRARRTKEPGKTTSNLGRMVHFSWRNVEWLPCADGKARPTQPGIHPLADGLPGRVGQLRAYGRSQRDSAGPRRRIRAGLHGVPGMTTRRSETVQQWVSALEGMGTAGQAAGRVLDGAMPCAR